MLAVVAIGIPLGAAYRLHHRYGLPYKLITVGLLTYSGSFALQTLVVFIFDGPLLDSPLFGAIFLAILIGFSDIGARFWGYHTIARQIVYRPQAVMIGVGHGMVRMVFNAMLLLFVVDDVGSQAVADVAISAGQLWFHVVMSWMVLQTFLRNELGWTFQAIFVLGFAFGTDAFIANVLDEPGLALIIWWSVVALLGWRMFRRLEPPPQFKWPTMAPL